MIFYSIPLLLAPAAMGVLAFGTVPTVPTVPVRPGTQAVEESAPATATDPAVVELLDRLERNSDGLTGFVARISYQTMDAVVGRVETRSGSIIYDATPKEGARFAATFESRTIGTDKRQHQQHYIFDGRWLAEVDYKRKQFIKREVVAPGEDFDPLRLGEGPLALPIGQPRDEVLERFSVVEIDRPARGLLARLPKDAIGLSLTPHPGTPEAKELERLDLFFDPVTLLPLGSLMVTHQKIDGENNTKTIRLSGIRRNPSFTPQQLRKLDITEPDRATWAIDVRRWGEG